MDKGNLYLTGCALLYSLQPIFVKTSIPQLPALQYYAFRCLGMLLIFLPIIAHYKNKIVKEAKQ
ncbi:MAG: hypothetical protein QXK06_04605, partial [Candidatus Diapherotrites archaeon]